MEKESHSLPYPVLSGIPESQCLLCLFDSLFAFLTHFTFVIQEMGEEDGNELGTLDSPSHLHLFRLGIAVPVFSFSFQNGFQIINAVYEIIMKIIEAVCLFPGLPANFIDRGSEFSHMVLIIFQIVYLLLTIMMKVF